jgi:hypothetical protein
VFFQPFKASSRAALFLSCILGVLSISGVARADLDFTLISQTTGIPAGYQGPSINSSGTVAFIGNNPGGTLGVYTGNGGALTTIATLSSSTSSGQTFQSLGNGGSPHINDSGVVGFTGILNNDGQGIYTGNGGALTTITELSPNTGQVFSGGINNSGVVSFQAQSITGEVGIYSGNGGNPTAIATYDPANPGPFDRFEGFPSINDDGVVAFNASNTSSNSNGVYNGDGASTTTVADTSSGFTQFLLPSINTDGTTAFTGITSNGQAGIYTSADLANPITTFDGLLYASLNDNGNVAFYTEDTSGNAGIYMQDGAGGFITVAQTGQTFMGGVISSLQFGSGGFNEFGQVAFVANFYGGGQSVYRASVVATPEPSTWAMMIMGAGVCVVLTRRRKSRGETGRTFEEI